jgi:hypothetical protein
MKAPTEMTQITIIRSGDQPLEVAADPTEATVEELMLEIRQLRESIATVRQLADKLLRSTAA